jgi:hypothetical protein
MKELVIHTGGHQRTALDLEWESDGRTEVSKGWGKGFPNNAGYLATLPAYYLQYFNLPYVDGTDMKVDAGWMIWTDGEPLRFDDQTLAIVGGQTLYWERVVVYDSSNPIMYFDGTGKNVHKDTYLRMVYLAPGSEDSNHIKVIDIITLKDLIQKMIYEGINTIGALTIGSGLTELVAITVFGIFSDFLKSFYAPMKIELQGMIQNTSGSTISGWKEIVSAPFDYDLLFFGTFNKVYSTAVYHDLGETTFTVVPVRAYKSGGNLKIEVLVSTGWIDDGIVNLGGTSFMLPYDV